MRKLIAAMKLSADGKFEGPESMADWADAWSEDYGLTPQIDACLLGGGMYPGYESYWTGIQNEPQTPAWIRGTPPTQAELAWSRFITTTPHYVLSRTLNETNWQQTHFLRSIDDVVALKQQSGKDVYLVGGGQLTASLIDAGLVDELRTIVYPVICGEGKALFASIKYRHALELRDVRQLDGGRIFTTYAIVPRPNGEPQRATEAAQRQA